MIKFYMSCGRVTQTLRDGFKIINYLILILEKRNAQKAFWQSLMIEDDSIYFQKLAFEKELLLASLNPVIPHQNQIMEGCYLKLSFHRLLIFLIVRASVF